MILIFFPKALFSVPSGLTNINNNLYLVVRVDKVLSGPLNSSMDKYTKCPNTNISHSNLTNGNVVNNGGVCATSSLAEYKNGTNLYRSMINYCQNIGKYRVPFAWGAW